ncbi:MAG TPA: maltotransferase domain-containing protein, partial [Propionibacteriaceae bacterium]|nr:maltotransferase domain-containing protein [Propionibacteriaceae bacterium]
MTATNSGFPVPERDDAAQPGSAESSSPQASTATPTTTGSAKPSVTVDQPALGAPIDRIPVHKVSPVIEGGAYPAKAVVGEAIPIRATVFREG